MSTLRARLLLHFGLIVLLCTALTVGVAAAVLRARARSAEVSVLQRQVDALAGTLAADSAPRVFASSSQRAVRRLAPGREAAVLAAVPPSADRTGRIALLGRDLLYAERQGDGGGRLVLVRPAALGAGDAGSYGLALVLAGLGGAAVAVLLAVYLSRTLTRPLHELALAAERVAGGEEGVKVPVEGRDEIALLAGSFNSMSGALAQARRAERSFLLSVSHELRTPLTAIQGHAEGLEDGAVSAAAAGSVIAVEARRLERLIRDLLDIARVSQPSFSVELGPTDLRALAEQAREQFTAAAARGGLDLRLQGDQRSSELVAADSDRALQVLGNLLENALRMTPRGGQVTITVAGRELRVSDTGPGIAPTDHERAFERFYLHARTPEERRQGSGLGLAIVRELMEAMGGSVALRSAQGAGGAEFVLRFQPAQPPQLS